MTVKQRILTIRLMEKMKQEPEYARRLEITILRCGQKKKKN